MRSVHIARRAARRKWSRRVERRRRVVRALPQSMFVAGSTPLPVPAAPVVETPAAPDVNVPNAPAAEVKEEQGVPMLSGDMSAEPAPVPAEKSKDETV